MTAICWTNAHGHRQAMAVRESRADGGSAATPGRRTVVGALGLTTIGGVLVAVQRVTSGSAARNRDQGAPAVRSSAVEVPLWPGRDRPSMRVVLPDGGGETP